MTLWHCPKCGRGFAGRGQTHTCSKLGTLDQHFENADPEVRAIYEQFFAVLSRLGPVTVLPEKTRIAFQVSMSFAALMPRRKWMSGHLILARRVVSPRLHRVEVYSPGNVLHAFRLTSVSEVDDEFAGWLAEAYRVGLGRRAGRLSER
jgi:hypothetical protein